ncbi:MAG: hypothetical protein WCO57_04060 [Verrucomicrobiota bacterium]
MLGCCGLAVMAASGSAWAAAVGNEPNKTTAQPGHATVNVWADLLESGRESTPQSVRDAISTVHEIYPDEIPWFIPAANSARMTLALDELGPGEGLSMVRVRCLLTAPQDGYYLLSLEGDGHHQVLLSSDASPKHLRPLWTSGKFRFQEPVGLDPDGFSTEGSWQYFKRNEARYVEIRHLHLTKPVPLALMWTLPDGTRQRIPDTCVASVVPPSDDVELGDGTTPDGVYGEVLHSVKAKPVELDLATAKALSTGWAAFDGTSTTQVHEAGPTEDYVKKNGISGCFGGDLEFPFVTKAAGYAVLTCQIQLCTGTKTYAHVLCEREIDGVRFDRETLRAIESATTPFRCITPWLEAGKHTLRLHFTPAMLGATCRLFAVGLQTLTGDATGAEVRAMLEKQNGFLPERGDGGFLRSPACVEMAARTSVAPSLQAGGREIPTRPATSNTWWADVPLPESGDAVALVARSKADRTELKATAHWALTRVSEHPEIYLRVGDALRVTACPADAETDVKATAVLTFRGKQTATGKPWICRFDQAGDEVVEAQFKPQHGAPVISRMTVHVLPRRTEMVETAMTRTDRRNDLEGFIAGCWPDGGDAVMFRACPADAGCHATRWSAYPQLAGTWPAVTRAGANGPVLGMLRVRAVGVSQTFGSYTDFKFGQGIRHAACHRCVVTGLPPGWKIQNVLAPQAKPGWQFYQPDPAHPSQRTVNPWCCGAVTVGEFWMLQGGGVGWREGACELVPPADPSVPPKK